MRWVIGLFIDAGILYLLSNILSGFELASFGSALIASIILSIVYAIIRPIVIVLTLPATIFTFGLFLFVINALMLMITASFMGNAFIIDSFTDALIAAIIVGVVQMFIKPIRK